MVKAARGGYVGGQPRYGRRVGDAELVDDPREAELVAFVMALRKQGASYSTICQALADAGFKPRRASGWQPMVVRSIARRVTS